MYTHTQPNIKKLALFWGGIALAFVLILAGFLFLTHRNAHITSIKISRGIDALGNPVSQTATFSSVNDHSIYVVLGLDGVRRKTQVSYIRYYNDKYIDSKVIIPQKDGAQSVFFSFEKGIGNYPTGTYKIVTYIDGSRGPDATYSFQ